MSAKVGNKLIISPNGKDVMTIDQGKVKKAALTISALNHPLRKQIIALLEDGNKVTVTEIFRKIKTEQSVASQHLAILRKAEILGSQRDGKFIYYFINTKRLEEVHRLINELAQIKQ